MPGWDSSSPISVQSRRASQVFCFITKGSQPPTLDRNKGSSSPLRNSISLDSTEMPEVDSLSNSLKNSEVDIAVELGF